MHVCLDSRLIQPGDYFVPIAGENFDGHNFIDQAIKAGARGVIEEEELYRIASEKLKNISPKIVAITGSVGKSSTRDYIAKMLIAQYKVCVGNLNTKLGLATNIVNDMNEDCEYFVAECGMDRKGELKETGEFLNPDIVVLTNISESHMEKLGSLEAIIDAKFELVKTVKAGGKVYLNWSNENVQKGAHKFGVKEAIKYGEKIDEIIIKNSKLIGIHNLVNLQCAYLIARAEKISKVKILGEVRTIKNPKGRLSLIDGVNGSYIIDDSYNASPVSAVSALQAVSDFLNQRKLKGRKIAVLGGMLELGSYEDEGHRLVGNELAKQKFDILLTVGPLSRKILVSQLIQNFNIKIYSSETLEDAFDILTNKIIPSTDDVILFKASQGIRLEKIIPSIMEDAKKSTQLLVRQDQRWS